MKLFSTQAAAKYLNLAQVSVRYHVNCGHLQPDVRAGRAFLFTQSTLDTFRQKHQAEGLTLAEAATYLGVSYSHMKYHFFDLRSVAAIGRRGKEYIFNRSSLDAARPVITAPPKSRRKAKSLT